MIRLIIDAFLLESSELLRAELTHRSPTLSESAAKMKFHFLLFLIWIFIAKYRSQVKRAKLIRLIIDAFLLESSELLRAELTHRSPTLSESAAKMKFHFLLFLIWIFIAKYRSQVKRAKLIRLIIDAFLLESSELLRAELTHRSPTLSESAAKMNACGE